GPSSNKSKYDCPAEGSPTRISGDRGPIGRTVTSGWSWPVVSVTAVSRHVTLKLVMIRCPDNVAPQRREIRGGEFAIGRGQDNEWVVPDPARHLSKRHCRVIYYPGEGEWELHDLSTNGTFLNQAADPIGRGAAQKLRHGDRIKFGLYEIEVSIDEDE